MSCSGSGLVSPFLVTLDFPEKAYWGVGAVIISGVAFFWDVAAQT